MNFELQGMRVDGKRIFISCWEPCNGLGNIIEIDHDDVDREFINELAPLMVKALNASPQIAVMIEKWQRRVEEAMDDNDALMRKASEI